MSLLNRKGFYEILGYMNNEEIIDFDMKKFVDELKKRTQFEWFENCVFGAFGYGIIMPFKTILTKYGLCFTFNMQPAENMFNLDK